MPIIALLPWLNYDWYSYGLVVLLDVEVTQDDCLALGEEDYDLAGCL